MTSGVWAKKYMLVGAGVEYTITASCNDQPTLLNREDTWDAIVRSFRSGAWLQDRDAVIKTRRVEAAGALFEKAYETAAAERYPEAITLLEQYLGVDPDHILAHKELAFILKNTGDAKKALPHCMAVKRLDPTDKVNLHNLAGLYAILGKKDEAIHEIDELLKLEPDNPMFLKFKNYILSIRFE